MDKKIGTYICSGCGIGDAVDVAALENVASREYKVPLCKTHPFLCGDEGSALIRQDIAAGDVNAVVVAACSNRVNSDVFSFGTDALLDRVDLREKVVWSHEPGHEDTLMLAEDYLRMGLAKMKVLERPVPDQTEMNETVLVIGGGITGLTAAANATAAGTKVVLVEKQDRLGGFLNHVKQTLPRRSPYAELQANDIAATVRAVEENPDVTVKLGTTIASIEGAPGRFDVTLSSEPEAPIRVGAIVVATGWRPYELEKLPELGAGLPNVVSNVQFEEMAHAGRIVRPSDGRAPRRVLFIQCAGSRTEKHLAYCSSVCCSVSLKHAVYLREQDPDASATIVYTDMRTPGTAELFYKKVQQDPGVFLTRGDVTRVEPAPGDELLVSIENTLLGEPLAVRADLLVLALGMVPSTYDPSVTVDKPAAEMTDRDLFKVGKAPILNLTYRKGPELPALNDGFPDSHYICFPYETQRTGIYSAGAVRQPQDVLSAVSDAAGAALKAIQCIHLGNQGQATHPRVGDTSYPEFALQTCVQCKRCTEECPFGVLDEDEKGNPLPNPTRCRRCGICMGACPQRIINFKDYSVPMVASMVKAVEVPDEDSGKLRILAFICENDALPAVDMAGISRLKHDASVRFIPLRCLGSLNIVWIADALAAGVDGILLLGCQYGDDYQCHFVRGSQLANERMGKVQETLDRLALESDRIRVEQFAINEYRRLPALIEDFLETIRGLDPNPYKGF